jgi:2-desacetyl-2-hydroxyethyl bacteriochlorophyllide A dehydrogenase
MKTRRIVFTGPGQAVLEDTDIPDAPLAPYEVLLRIAYSAISTGTEIANYSGDHTLFPNPDRYPIYPGYAAVGEVIAAGDEAPVRLGDLVLAHVPHQAIARFDSRDHVCVRVPHGVPPEQATLARIAQVSAVSLGLMAAVPGDQAAITGLGLVGNLAAQLAYCAGLRVLGVEPLAERRRIAERRGIVQTLDPGVLTEGAQEADDLTDSCRVVLECSGQDRGLLTALSLAAPRGEVFLVGAAWKRGTAVVAADVVRPVFRKYLALRSGWEWQIPLYNERPLGSIAGCTAWILAFMRDGALHLEELITDRVSPAEVPAAYADLREHPAEHLGVVIDWQRM